MSVIGYKVFNSNWTCRGFQYEVGKTYTQEEFPQFGHRGFHFCFVPYAIRWLSYQFHPYNKYALVEVNEPIEACCYCGATNKITILKEISYQDMYDLATRGLYENDILQVKLLPPWDTTEIIEAYYFVNFPDGILSIAEYGFNDCITHKKLYSFLASNDLQVIQDCAFCNCSALSRIYLPATVKYIAPSAFDGCVNLRDIYYGGSREEWDKIIGLEDYTEQEGKMLSIGKREVSIDKIFPRQAVVHYNSTKPEI